MGPISYIAAASSIGLVVMTGLYLDKRDDLAQAIESCNSDKYQTALESSEIARKALQEAAERRFAELEAIALASDAARRIAEEARLEAESRPEKVRTVIREVAGENKCLDIAVPVRLLQCVRSAESCGPADHS